MHRYLIVYEPESEQCTFDADDIEHAIEQFIDCNFARSDNKTNLNSIIKVEKISV